MGLQELFAEEGRGGQHFFPDQVCRRRVSKFSKCFQEGQSVSKEDKVCPGRTKCVQGGQNVSKKETVCPGRTGWRWDHRSFSPKKAAVVSMFFSRASAMRPGWGVGF